VADYDRDLKKVLGDHGCRYKRQGNGSHEVWYSPITQRHITVPMKIKSRHTANAILKQAGIDHRF
jgi:predicted RNA binding protein YcfA (HicA-like mRNA interferase family)